MTTKNRVPSDFLRVALGTIGLLLIPVLGKWPWSMGDYIIMASLIFATGMTLYFVTNKIEKRYQLPLGAMIILVFLLIWAQLAVDLFEKVVAGSQCVATKGISQLFVCREEVLTQFQDT